MNISCESRSLDDIPSAADDFGGAHDSIAESLLAVVQNEAGGRVIALEGQWGSGKSTVVRLLQKKAADRAPASRVLVFNVWNHDGDPLRRAFLASLIKQLSESQWIDGQAWKQRFEEFSGRTKTSRSTAVTNFGWIEIVLAAMFILVPIGLVILGGAFQSGNQTDAHWFDIVVGLALIILPVLLIISLRAIGVTISPTIVWNQPPSPSTLTEESLEPTSIEFMDAFSQIMDDCFSTHSRDRLILIIDNLDRISEVRATQVWSTLRPFFDLEETDRHDWLSRLWIIVPYDPTAMKRLWNSSGPTAATDFLDKLVQLRFTVPTTPLYRWKVFLESGLSKALPSHDKRERNDLSSIVSYYYHLNSVSVTPRGLILLINDIVVLHMQWCGVIPLTDITYYVLLCRDGVNVIDRIQSGDEYPPREFQEILSKDAQVHLCALGLGVSPSDAVQLLVQPQVESALASGDGDSLVRIARDTPGFADILDRLLMGDSEGRPAQELLATARAIQSARLVAGDSLPAVERIRSWAIRTGHALSTISPLDQASGLGLSALVTLADDNAVSLKAAEVVSSGSSGKDVSSWLECAWEVASALGKISGGANLQITFNGDGSSVIALCDALAMVSAGNSQVAWLRVTDESNMTGYLSEAIVAGSVTEQFQGTAGPASIASAMPFLVHVAPINWAPISQALLQRLQNTLSIEEVDGLLRMARFLDADQPALAQQLYAELWQSGWSFSHLGAVSASGSKETVALAVAAIIRAARGFSSPVGVAQSASGDAFLKSELSRRDLASTLTPLLGRKEDLASLLESSRIYTDNSPLLNSLIAGTLSPQTLPSLLDRDNFLYYWPEILDALPNSSDSVPLILAADSLFDIRNTLSTSEDPWDPGTCHLYYLLVEAITLEDDTTSKFIQWNISGLEQISSEQWVSFFKDDDWAIDLAAEVFTKCNTFELPNVENAVEWAASAIADNEKVSDSINFEKFGLLLDEDRNTIVRANFLRVAVERGSSLPAGFFQRLGSEFGDREMIVSNGSIVHQLFIPLLESNHAAGIKWMKDLLESNPGILSELKPVKLTNAWKGELRKKLPNGDENLLALAKAAGVRPGRSQAGSE